MSIARHVESAASAAAACSEADPELFFPVSEQHTSQVAEAKSFCRSCPVRESCLRFALTEGIDEGIFGGLTATERRRVRVLRRRDIEQDDQGGSGEVAA